MPWKIASDDSAYGLLFKMKMRPVMTEWGKKRGIANGKRSVITENYGSKQSDLPASDYSLSQELTRE